MRWYFLLAAVAIFGFKQLLEARENAAVAGPGWWVVGIPGRWSSGLHLPPATGRGARGGASGQCQPQPYGINLIGGLFDIWLHGGGVVTPQQYRKGGVPPPLPRILLAPFPIIVKLEYYIFQYFFLRFLEPFWQLPKR